MNIYVGNLPFSATEDDITELFSSFGDIDKVHLPADRDTGKFRGFAFVDMHDSRDGGDAIDALNGTDFGGRKLTVNEARPRESRRGGR